VIGGSHSGVGGDSSHTARCRLVSSRIGNSNCFILCIKKTVFCDCPDNARCNVIGSVGNIYKSVRSLVPEKLKFLV